MAKHEKQYCWGVHPRTPTPDGGSLFPKTDLPFQFDMLSSVVKKSESNLISQRDFLKNSHTAFL